MASDTDEIEKMAKGMEGDLKKIMVSLSSSMNEFKEAAKVSIPDSVRTVGNMVVSRHGSEVRIKFTTPKEATDHIQSLVDNAG